MTVPARRFRLLLSRASVTPSAFTPPPLAEASRRKAADFATVTRTLPPEVLSEQSSTTGPARFARIPPPLVCAVTACPAESMRMLPPEVASFARPASCPTSMLPPVVCRLASPRALANTMLPPDVRASTLLPIVPSLIEPPDVGAETVPPISPTVMPPPEVRSSAANLAGTVMTKSTVTGVPKEKRNPDRDRS